VDLGDGSVSMALFVNKNFPADYKAELIKLLKMYIDCFA